MAPWSIHSGVLSKTFKALFHGPSPLNQMTATMDDTDKKTSYSQAQRIGLFLGPTLFTLTLLFFAPADLSFEARAVLATTLWVATWWITEAIPIPATSLLPIVLLPITGALSNGTVTSAYGDDIIFLFLGGFFIATAMEKWHLHRRIALAIIAFVGTSTQRILLGFMLATAFLSMWVSNTAAVMMMIPSPPRWPMPCRARPRRWTSPCSRRR
jgi:solute carrier family 13 (sodium-dependent dicarboxylate transporter), member 2/3/5